MHCGWGYNRGKKDCAFEYIIREKATYLGTKSGKMDVSGDIFGGKCDKKNRPSCLMIYLCSRHIMLRFIFVFLCAHSYFIFQYILCYTSLNKYYSYFSLLFQISIQYLLCFISYLHTLYNIQPHLSTFCKNNLVSNIRVV